MPEITITGLPNASALDGTERVPMDQAGVTVDASALAIAQTLPNATTSVAGKMSAADKTRIDELGADDSPTFAGLTVTGLLTANHIHGNLAGALYVHVKNTSGGQLTAGTPVRVTGAVGDTTTLEIAGANAAASNTMPAIAVLGETLAANASGHGVVAGEITGLNTAGYTVGQALYVASGGGLTGTAPAANIQVVAIVGRVSATTGTIAVSIDAVLGSAALTASTDYAPAAQGVTNGNSHDHNGGDGAQIAYSSLSGLPTLPTGTNTGDQTIANTSDATSHTVTLSASGGSVQLVEGSNITLTTSGTSGAGVVTIASAGGAPGGSDTQVQFNDGGAFGGDVDLTYNKTTNLLTTKGDIRLDDGGTFTTTIQTVTATANRTLSYPDATGTLALVAGSSGQLTYNLSGALAGTSVTFDASTGTRHVLPFGYGAGAGGTVTQATNKSTAVTLSTRCGQVTMNNANLVTNTAVTFTLTNTQIAATDVLMLNHVSGGTLGTYSFVARCAAGSATISVRNVTAGDLAEAVVIAFAVIKATTT